jgi:fatty-acyl-CoA synthase
MAVKTYQPGENYQYQLLIKKLLMTPLAYSPNQEIVYRDKFRYTYKDFNVRVHKLANALTGLGVKEGDTVCVFDYDSHRYLECFFAVPMMGAVLHTMNWRLSPDQILYTMNHAEDDIVLINSDFLPVLEEIWDKLETVKKVVVLYEDGTVETKLNIDGVYEDMVEAAVDSYDFPDLDENTRATTFYTTGTTGLPKGVFFSHRQLVLHAMSTAMTFGSYDSPCRFRSTDVYMPITPMFHVHAWGIPYVAVLLGCKQVYPGKYEPEMLLKLILTEKVTFSHCVPTILHMLVSSPVVKKIDLSNWKVVIGGAAFSKGLAQATWDLGIKALSGYGMSETCPVLTIANLKENMFDWDTDQITDVIIKTGLPIPLADLAIIGPDGKLLPHDGETTGELVARTPWLTASYFKDEERAKDLWRDGWLHTGDVAYVDTEGYFTITDRLKDVIKTGGEWISSLELENLISQHQAVSEAAAIGIPDVKWGERPMIAVVLKPEFKDAVTNDEMKSFMMKFVDDGKIPKYGVPDQFEFVNEIPKTSVGKINKIALRERFGK